MRRIDTLVIGGGQAGLAMSHCLSSRRIDHVVLERGRVAERWRRERWDSLRLLTPNWMTRLPGFAYDGPDPGGFLRVAEVVTFVERYAQVARAPVVPGAAVQTLRATADGYEAVTDAGTWRARAVVVATGHCDVARVPAMASGASSRLVQLVPGDYRSPAQLPPGGVLVVGASSSGVQLADELVRSGRRVTIAVGQHTRVPRLYRGRDLFEWLDRIGLLREPASRVYDLDISRAQPSLQLVGRPTHASLDLRSLAARGVAVKGRLLDLDGERAAFDDDLIATTAAADLKLAMLLRRIDRAAIDDPRDDDGPPEPLVPHWPAFIDTRAEVHDLARDGITSVIWATGFRRRYDWLQVPVVAADGDIVHDGGQTAAPGLYVLGLHFLRHRSSSFLDGVGIDAQFLADRIARQLGQKGAAA
jgi:putative flavoprotein involved in K+ transport